MPTDGPAIAGWPGSLALTSAACRRATVEAPARRAGGGSRRPCRCRSRAGGRPARSRESGGERRGEVAPKAPAAVCRREPDRARPTASTLVPSRRRSGTSTMRPRRATIRDRSWASGRSPCEMMTCSAPLPAIMSTPWSIAPLSPSPGPHSTWAPNRSAHSATSSSSQATNVGSGRAAAITRSAMNRASDARSASDSHRLRRPLAAANALIGISTAVSTPSTLRPGVGRRPCRGDGVRSTT